MDIKSKTLKDLAKAIQKERIKSQELYGKSFDSPSKEWKADVKARMDCLQQFQTALFAIEEMKEYTYINEKGSIVLIPE